MIDGFIKMGKVEFKVIFTFSIHEQLRESGSKTSKQSNIVVIQKTFFWHEYEVEIENANSREKILVEKSGRKNKILIQTSRKDFHDVGDGRFFVDADFETTFVESGVVMKGERDLNR